MSNLNIRCDLEKSVSNLRNEQYHNVQRFADYDVAVSLAEELDPFLWFMVTLVATFESFSISSPDITTILNFSLSVLHERGIKLFKDKEQSRFELFDPQIRGVLTYSSAIIQSWSLHLNSHRTRLRENDLWKILRVDNT